MTRTIGDLLSQQIEYEDGGRAAELAAMTRCLEDNGPVVVWLHGPAGVGKSHLYASFADEANKSGAVVYTVDCRTVEPTVAGLLASLGELLDTSFSNLEHAAAIISDAGNRVVVTFDNYEVFRLADSWLRREFIPALSQSARVMLVSREPPAAGWISATEWRKFFLDIPVTVPGDHDPEDTTRKYLEEVQDTDTRAALDAASVVRRVTRPMLAALCPDIDADTMFDRMSALSFVEHRQDGLAIVDSVRKVIGGRLQAADIDRYRHYQRAAWQQLRHHMKSTARADLWRCTADIIYLIENPVIREAFFPSESAQFSVEPATAVDREDVMAISEQHETPAAAEAMELWWKHLPTAFHVVKDATGGVVGFYCMAKPDELRNNWMLQDPVARNWLHHLESDGRSAAAPSLFLRRWLIRDEGEAPCAAQAAAWIDIKRTYLELRPNLRRVYLVLRDIAPYGPVATELGFTVLETLAANLSDTPYYTAMLDFGPGSVDGWICNLLAAELGVVEEQLLDAGSRELVVNGDRIALTPLEFNLLSMLESRASDAVSRTELLQQVWGHDYDGGSNVVDVAVRGLRKKCGEHAGILETVRGVGYRLRA